MEWVGNQLQIQPPARPKKITATRFAAILGKNPWTTPFEVWCEITRTYQKPFEDTIYTLAGKAVEPLQTAYMRKAYAMTNLRTPADQYGPDYFKHTRGDFFPDREILGGMWDALLLDDRGGPEAVLEFKTTKRAEDWATDIPEYYALQAALYAYLLGVDRVIMVASFLEEGDYQHPERFAPAACNTITREFSLRKRYPDFSGLVAQACGWWRVHVEGGISPPFDEKKDGEILKILRTNDLEPTQSLEELLAEAERLQSDMEIARQKLSPIEKRLKEINGQVKAWAAGRFREGDGKATVRFHNTLWTVTRVNAGEIDRAAMEEDGVLEKYVRPKTTYKLTVTKEKT